MSSREGFHHKRNTLEFIHDNTIMSHIFIKQTMHHISKNPSLSCINDNSLIHLHLCILIHLHWLVSTWHLSLSSRIIHIYYINQSILWHQSIKPLATMTTWSNNLPLWHWWQYQHWCQHQLPIIDVSMYTRHNLHKYSSNYA